MMPAPAAERPNRQPHSPRLIAWEVTRSCMLACKHCRAAARAEPYPDELSTAECFKLLDNIASFARPIIILTGGEPMLRPDIYDIAARATGLGMRVVMAPCGALIDDESAARILASGIKHISISLDGATAESHDAFRGVAGAFDASLRGIAAARRAGLGFQINTTITKHNLAELPAILELAIELGATVFNPFLLVPTGRGSTLIDQEISPQQYERTLRWLAGQQGREDINIRVTCAPHYQRIIRQLGLRPGQARPVKGCMGGQSFAFISHRGKVQICGFLDIECGDVRRENFDFRGIWRDSEIFKQMRDPASYHGRCGRCEFARVCGGCRARAYAMTGDYLGEEPFCLYQPKRTPGQGPPAKPPSPDDLDEQDRKILSIIQTDFPAAERPFDILAERLNADGEDVLARISRMRQDGYIRRLGAVFDSRSLGYASTLVAARIPPERLPDVAETVNALAGVTHNYRREHDYNLWFTLTAESEDRLGRIIEDLRCRTGIADFHSLPAVSVYKIRVDFQMDPPAEAPADRAAGLPPPPDQPVSFTKDHKRLVRLLQEDIPLCARPFGRIADELAWPVDRVVRQINDWLGAGVIRRFGAVVRHRRLGFNANGMAVFRVPPERIDEVGKSLAGHSEVSHCYRRPPLPAFDYNLFAMVHGQSADEVRAAVAKLAEQLHLSDYQVLFSAAEYKKTSMSYFE